LSLGLDNWAIVYLNGRQVAALDPADEFKSVKIPITINKGDNQRLIKPTTGRIATGIFGRSGVRSNSGGLRPCRVPASDFDRIAIDLHAGASPRLFLFPPLPKGHDSQHPFHYSRDRLVGS
jgi:hypothetical protein